VSPSGKNRGGTPEGVRAPKPGACRSPQGCGGYGTASYGVPLPFYFLRFLAFVDRH
jgi:hypothetical protein